MPLTENFKINGMVHITGGGFYDNIPRVLPENCGVEVDSAAWERPAIFNLLKEWGNVAWPEMYRTFNMGIGMVLVVPADEVDKIQAHLTESNEKSYIIGKVVAGIQEVVIKGGVFND
jgi:phosphoribosylformylglycinamidine cyclo-ligase